MVNRMSNQAINNEIFKGSFFTILGCFQEYFSLSERNVFKTYYDVILSTDYFLSRDGWT